MITDNDTFRSYPSKIEEIYNQWSKVTEKGSVINFSPVRKGKMQFNGLYGDTLQDGTPTPDTPVEIQNVTGLQNVEVCGKNIYNATLMEHTKNNLTYSADTTKLYFSGTSNAENKLDYGVTLLKAGTYTLNLKRISLNRNASFFIYKSGTWTPVHSDAIRLSDTIEKASLTFTLSEDTNIMLSMYYGNNLVFDNCSVEYQIVTGSSADYNFEPYKGNTYEVNLGKNLLNASQESYTFTAGVNSGQPIIGTINLKANTKYYVSYTIDTQMTSNTRSTPFLFLGNNKYYQYETTNVNLTTGRKVWEYTPTTSGTYSFGYWSHTPDVNLTVSKFMISKSSDTSYSPYFTPIELNKIPETEYEDSIKKSTGKNLFDKDNANTLNSIINGNNGTLSAFDTCRTIYIPCKPNTTYAVSRISGTRFVVGTTTNQPTIGMVCNSFIGNNTASSIRITTGENDNYLCVFYYNSGSDTLTEQAIRDTLMIQEGSIVSPYEPYGKVWYIENNIGKVVLNGSETWNYNPANEVFTLPDYVDYIRTGFIPYSNYYKGANISVYSQLNNNEISFLKSTSQNRTLIKNTNFTVLNDFKNWLSTHNTEVLYVLNTPTYTEITNTELINQLEELYTAKSYDNQTNISVDGDLPLIISASALMKGGI